MSGPFVVDYTKTVLDVYIEASRFALVGLKGLEALSYVGDRTTNQVHDLPSWVIDFSQKSSVKPFYANSKPFSTASSLQTILWFVTDHPNVVSLSGLHFDTVTATCSAHWPRGGNKSVNGISSIYNLVLNPQPASSMAKEAVQTILRRTLTADDYHTYYMNHQYDAEAAFDRWLFCQTCDAVAECDIQLAKSFVTDFEANFAEVMETLGISGLTQTLKGSLLHGRRQCGTWEKVVIGAKGRTTNLRHGTHFSHFAHYLDTMKD